MSNYIDVLKRGLGNISNVKEGWINSFKDRYDLLEEDKKQVAEERLKICLECPFNSENAKELGYKTSINNLHCSSCLCSLDKKVYSFNESCGLEWFITHASDEDQKHILEYYQKNNLELELKWKAIK